MNALPTRGGYRIPRRRGANSQGGRQHTNQLDFPKNCMKLRKFWSVGGARVKGAPPWIRHCLPIWTIADSFRPFMLLVCGKMTNTIAWFNVCTNHKSNFKYQSSVCFNYFNLPDLADSAKNSFRWKNSISCTVAISRTIVPRYPLLITFLQDKITQRK